MQKRKPQRLPIRYFYISPPGIEIVVEGDFVSQTPPGYDDLLGQAWSRIESGAKRAKRAITLLHPIQCEARPVEALCPAPPADPTESVLDRCQRLARHALGEQRRRAAEYKKAQEIQRRFPQIGVYVETDA